MDDVIDSMRDQRARCRFHRLRLAARLREHYLPARPAAETKKCRIRRLGRVSIWTDDKTYQNCYHQIIPVDRAARRCSRSGS